MSAGENFEDGDSPSFIARVLAEDAPPGAGAGSPAAGSVAAPTVAKRVRFFSLSERLGRIRYLVYAIMASLACIAVLLALYRVAALFPPALFVLISRIAFVCIGKAVLPAVFAILSIRRLHDINARGWWVILMLIPFAGRVLACIPGTKEPNRFGLVPPPNGRLLKFTVVIAPLLLIWMFMNNIHRQAASPGAWDGQAPGAWGSAPRQGYSNGPLRQYQP
ncbi:MAG: DUF805 domain-containing protein [Nevskia sp.]|nr:DUF805 domain-containing protein [Nevskia sp.]